MMTKLNVGIIKTLTQMLLKDEIDCSLATRNTDVNLGFEIFLRLIEIILDKHAPLKKGSRKKDKKSLTPRSRGE